MSSCCHDKGCELEALRTRHRSVLRAVLVINAAMFVIEGAAGLVAGSTALLGDALDMLGDTSVYAVSLYALDRGALWRARAALLKGALMAVFGAGVLAEAAVHAVSGRVPAADTMGIVGGLALVANLACLVLLLRHRSDDLNMRSTWLCSRNDVIANVAVLGAAGLVHHFASSWPDVTVGAGIAALFLWSARDVLHDALAASRSARSDQT